MAAEAPPSDEALRAKLEAVLPTVDLEATGLKQFIKLLSQEFGGINLKGRKAFIKQALTETLMETLTETVEKQARENEQDSSPEEDDEDDDVAALSTPKKKQVSGGLAAKKEISPSLAHFLGQGGVMARTEIVKALWEYIRTHNLQNPANKQEIVLDEAMRAVFECKVFTMFTMNKYISAHVHPFKAVDLTPTPKASRKRKSPGSAKSAKSAASSGKKRKAGTQPPYRLSEALTVVVGTDILPRPQVVSKLWVYIRAHNLQNPKDKREILCDSALRKVFGGKAKVSMFKMNTFISDHLIEKVDKALYRAEDVDDE